MAYPADEERIATGACTSHGRTGLEWHWTVIGIRWPVGMSSVVLSAVSPLLNVRFVDYAPIVAAESAVRIACTYVNPEGRR